MARPTKYTKQLADTICQRIAEGESLNRICADKKIGVDRGTVVGWTLNNEEFYRKYARAREVQAELLADEITDIADTPQVGERLKTLPDGKVEVVKGDMIEHRRLRVDTRKWYLSKVLPKKYGDKHQVEHGGGVEVRITRKVINADG